ncbi:hypothetical protein NDU88_000843 [Pleurodeles waltl]|uniref:Uncharacterized protein n=1 Tax=Pleurodeles waltl TaxID=8319 RepID=A0AAV7S5N9_PLEWA|nr:hypothetical protein NDU88_000843 [Pleurodeles waltl]
MFERRSDLISKCRFRSTFSKTLHLGERIPIPDSEKLIYFEYLMVPADGPVRHVGVFVWACLSRAARLRGRAE